MFFRTAILFLAAFAALAGDAQAVVMNWSPVGNVGNAADTVDGDQFTPGTQNLQHRQSRSIN